MFTLEVQRSRISLVNTMQLATLKADRPNFLMWLYNRKGTFDRMAEGSDELDKSWKEWSRLENAFYDKRDILAARLSKAELSDNDLNDFRKLLKQFEDAVARARGYAVGSYRSKERNDFPGMMGKANKATEMIKKWLLERDLL